MVFSCQWVPGEPPTQHWPPILHSQNAMSLSLWHTPVVPISLHYRAKESFTVTFLCCNTCGSWMEGRGSTLATCRAPAPSYLLQSCNCNFSCNCYRDFSCNCNSHFSWNWETMICKPANAEDVHTVVWRICFDLELDDISFDHTEFCCKSLEEGRRNKNTVILEINLNAWISVCVHIPLCWVIARKAVLGNNRVFRAITNCWKDFWWMLFLRTWHSH